MSHEFGDELQQKFEDWIALTLSRVVKAVDVRVRFDMPCESFQLEGKTNNDVEGNQYVA